MPRLKRSHAQIIARALRHLARNRLMALGTCTKSGKPWGATVFYAFDRDFTILFYSRENTTHCKHLRANPDVSIVVNHSWRNPDGTISGLQMTGKAKPVLPKDYTCLYNLYKQRFSWADNFKNDHVLYQIKPKEIWLIDEKFFGHFYRRRV